MITRDNYQEYFLLYIDNELSMADRLVVEQWVAENPDFQEEWETLLSCRVGPDATVVFRDRASLLRSVDGIGEDNYTEYLLSYIDGELNPKDQGLVEEFIRRHPSKRTELEQLRQTVSVPDRMVVFPDKNLLYKKEKDRRVIFFYWTAAGVAAVLLGIVALVYLQGHHAVAPAVDKPAVDAPAVAKNLPPVPVDNSVKKEEPTVTPAPTAALYPTEVRKKEKKTEVKEEAPVMAQTVVPGVPEKQEARPVEVAIAAVPENTNKVEATARTNEAVAVNIPREQSSFATQALMAEDEEKEFIMNASESSQPNKSKLRGLFRKVARTLGKTADRDGEGKKEVLINAFQVAVN